jgi:hypothetical protein
VTFIARYADDSRNFREKIAILKSRGKVGDNPSRAEIIKALRKGPVATPIRDIAVWVDRHLTKENSHA